MAETKLNDPKINIEKYKKNKQSLQEGFETIEYKTCTPVEDDGVTEVRDYTVSEQPGVLETKNIEETFKWVVVFIFVIIISCIVFPVVAIWAIVKDNEDNNGSFHKLMLTLVWVGLFIAAFPMITSGGEGKITDKANRLITGVLLIFIVLFTWISITGAKMWGMKITEKWDYSKYFSSSDRSFMFYLDVFGVSYDTGPKLQV